MLIFGPLSSVFDYATFAMLLFVLRADKELFRTGWFLESVISACLVVLVIRSRRPFWRSRPSAYLLATTALVAANFWLNLRLSGLAQMRNFRDGKGFCKAAARRCHVGRADFFWLMTAAERRSP
jgi:Mg2+-importing ATPase